MLKNMKLLNLNDGFVLNSVQNCIKHLSRYGRLWSVFPPNEECQAVNRLKYYLGRCVQIEEHSEYAVIILVCTILNEELNLSKVLDAFVKPPGLKQIPASVEADWKDIATLSPLISEHKNIFMNLILEIIWVISGKIDQMLHYEPLRIKLRYKTKQENVNVLCKLRQDIITHVAKN